MDDNTRNVWFGGMIAVVVGVLFISAGFSESARYHAEAEKARWKYEDNNRTFAQEKREMEEALRKMDLTITRLSVRLEKLEDKK